MSKNDRMIMLVIPILAVFAGFWFMAIAPKRDKVQKLDAQVTQLESSVANQQASVQKGLQARRQFPDDYHRLVVMGKAVPVQDETPSLIVQISRIARRSGISFRKIDLAQNTGSAAATAAAPTTTTAAVPTESAASLLPIGASVGSASFPVMPYTLEFQGNYFEVAQFMAGVDALVGPDGARIRADGRLMTIDSFTLSAPGTGSGLKATMNVTTFVTPADQGLTAGATPTAPAGTTAVPASSTTPTTGTTP